jgi:hypothetical protein
MHSNFLLEKWYMDVVATDGSAAIGYFARLRWRKLSFSYQGYIHRSKIGVVKIHNSLRKGEAPQWRKNELSWNAKNFKGKWQPIDSPVRMDLIKNTNSFIDWHCLMPKGNGKVFVGNDSVEGLGYAEKMMLNIFPWKLPIEELYWGRFLCEEYSLTWIEWREQEPKIIVLLNGSEIERVSISNECIQASDLTLTFLSKYELRSGSIGNTIFKGIWKILSAFPSTIFQLNENKWCGVANLSISNRLYRGAYIHEQVIWP